MICWPFCDRVQVVSNIGLILGLHTASERRRYKVTAALIGWAQPYNQPSWICDGIHSLGDFSYAQEAVSVWYFMMKNNLNENRATMNFLWGHNPSCTGPVYILDPNLVIISMLGYQQTYPDSKVHGANMGPTWVLSAPDGPHVGPRILVIRVVL